jgi:hypothetical protein
MHTTVLQGTGSEPSRSRWQSEFGLKKGAAMTNTSTIYTGMIERRYEQTVREREREGGGRGRWGVAKWTL